MNIKRWNLLPLILPAGCILTGCILTGCNGNTPAERNDLVPQAAHKVPTGLIIQDMAGRPHDLDSILGRGQSIALVFWQTWCKPCLREMPELARVDRQYSPRIRFYGIVSGTDEDVDDAKVKSLVERLGVGYPQVRDRDLRLSRGFKIDGTPTIVILGPGRSVLYRGHQLPDNWAVFTKRNG